MIGLITGGISAVTGLVTSIFGSAEQREKNKHAKITGEHNQALAQIAADAAVLGQFAAEFSPRDNRTWWDSLWDGLNRAPRPIMALGTIGLFVWAVVDPIQFTVTMEALSIVPEYLWGILATIIAFYFAGRMQLKNITAKGPSLDAAQKIIELQKQADRMKADAEPRPTSAEYEAAMADTTKPLPNAVIQEWNRRQTASTGQ